MACSVKMNSSRNPPESGKRIPAMFKYPAIDGELGDIPMA
jgi:hypothetical protein